MLITSDSAMRRTLARRKWTKSEQIFILNSEHCPALCVVQSCDEGYIFTTDLNRNDKQV